MHITEKGQVTIPQNIRIRYGFLPNSEVEFVEEKGKVFLKLAETKDKKTRGRSLVEHLRGKGDVKMTTDEIMQLTRGEE